jgi:hypothetical protein
MRFLIMMVLIASTVSAGAADLGRSPAARQGDAAGYCPSSGGSRIASLATLEAMRLETDGLYREALSAFADPRVQASRGSRHVWADLARITCGIASGHLQSSEVNVERLNACECNYVRMLRF